MGSRPSLDCSVCGQKLEGGALFLCGALECDTVLRQWRDLSPQERPPLTAYYRQIRAAKEPSDDLRHGEQRE